MRWELEQRRWIVVGHGDGEWNSPLRGEGDGEWSSPLRGAGSSRSVGTFEMIQEQYHHGSHGDHQPQPAQKDRPACQPACGMMSEGLGTEIQGAEDDGAECEWQADAGKKSDPAEGEGAERPDDVFGSGLHSGTDVDGRRIRGAKGGRGGNDALPLLLLTGLEQLPFAPGASDGAGIDDGEGGEQADDGDHQDGGHHAGTTMVRGGREVHGVTAMGADGTAKKVKAEGWRD